MRVWRATPGEAADVARLLVAFRDHLGLAWPGDAAFRASVERLLADPGTEFLLGAVAEAPAGVVQLRFRWGMWRDGGDCLVEDVFVEETARGHGLARALLELATERARLRGCTRMELDVSEDNAAALALYGNLGFTGIVGPGRDLYLRRHLTETPLSS